MRKGLTDKNPGRKPNGFVKDEELKEKLEEIYDRLNEVEAEKKKLIREKEGIVDRLWMAEQAITFVDKTFSKEHKKKEHTQKILKQLFSKEQKKQKKEGQQSKNTAGQSE